MPTFELVILIKQLNTQALKTVLKRGAGYIFDSGATIRKMTNLGFRDLPYAIYHKGTKHFTAHYFIIDYDSGMATPKALEAKFALDFDVIRARSIIKAYTPFKLHNPDPEPECTMHLDLLPPPKRKNIIKLQEEAEKKLNKIHPNYKNFDDQEFLIF